MGVSPSVGHSSSSAAFDTILEMVKAASTLVFKVNATKVEGSASSSMDTKAKPESLVAPAENSSKLRAE